MTTRIGFVRHGHVHNPRAVHYGRLPGFGLSERGRTQAQAAAQALRDVPIATLYSSPLQRAQETAAAIQAVHPHLTPVLSPLLSEVYTPFDGQPHSVLAARQWDAYTGTPPEYEQPGDVLDRAREFIAQVRRACDGQHVIATTHGDVISFLILWARGLPIDPQYKETLATLDIPGNYPAPASITTLTYHTAAPGEVPEMEHLVPYAR